jgi:ATP-dependent DNA helicase PIF1
MEEMLCSLASPCFLMWVSKGGQYKARGDVITFSQDITQLCTTLPRLPEQLDILVVRRNDPTYSTAYKDFRVRKDKVFRLLRFLKEHNRYYTDITIRSPESVDLPKDDSILDRLPLTEPRDDNPVQPASGSTHPESATSDEEPASQELAHEQNSFVPSLAPLPSEQDAITTAMTDSGLASCNAAPLPWPPTGPALSEYSTLGLFSMAFPTLFPLALADISLRRDRKIELHEWVKHLMRYRDSRFATHPRFRFFALNVIFRHRSMQRGKYLFSRNISHRNMTIGQLKEALSRHDGPRLAADIVRCLKTVKATRPYWNMEGGKLRDMIAQIGTPTFFYTLSMADMSWPDLHKLMPDNPFAPGLTPTQSSHIRFHNVATNPHIVVNYLTTKHHHLMDTVLQHLDLEDNARVLDFWYRFEWQARGSGDTHLLCHITSH